MDVKKAGRLAVRLIAAVLAVMSCDALAAADLYDAINRLRAGQGACATAQIPVALTRQPALERAALDLARGYALPDSLMESGYRASASLFISISGADSSEDAVTVLGYKFRATGENIAAGPSTPEGAVAGWIKSPSHCANLMNPTYTEMGVAFSVERNSDFGVYWAQVFGSSR